MELGLHGKRALVAASSGGLGFAIARVLASEGCRVSMCSRSTERVGEAARRIADETGAEVHFRGCDVRDPAGLHAWVEESADRMGGLDLVVPNSGGPPSGRFMDLDEGDWEAAVELLLLPPIRLVRYARPYLGPGSAVLFMTSSSIREPIAQLTLSTVVRAGVVALAKSLANEWAPDGIRVNHLIPGRIATARVAELDRELADRTGTTPAEVRQRISQSIPLGRYGEPEEYARAAAFLLSDAASYITGATLQVDGGAIQAIV